MPRYPGHQPESPWTATVRRIGSTHRTKWTKAYVRPPWSVHCTAIRLAKGGGLAPMLAVASPLETIVALLKANVGPVVTAGTIKSKGIEFDTLKYLARVENPANLTPEVTLLQSMSFFLKKSWLKIEF